jgi:hypothetical protein
MASKTRENYFAQYKSTNRWKSNREARLLRALQRNPENAAQIEAAIGNMVYRRQTPTTPQWSHTMIREAKLFKEFCGSAPIQCWSSNPKVREAALAKLGRDWTQVTLPEGKVDFSLMYRIANPAGPRK